MPSQKSSTSVPSQSTCLRPDARRRADRIAYPQLWDIPTRLVDEGAIGERAVDLGYADSPVAAE
jgi:hypothetical protein